MSALSLAPVPETMLLRFLNALAGFAALFGDTVLARYGKLLVWAAQKYLHTSVPNSAVFSDTAAAETVNQVQRAMDEEKPDGTLGGWNAGLAVIHAKRQAGAPLFALPEPLAVALLMGLPGDFTPASRPAARNLLARLKVQYFESGHNGYLYMQAHQAAVKKLMDADKAETYVGSGILKKMFETRKTESFELGSNARERAVLTYFQNTPELVKFLRKDARGHTQLPTGTNYAEFAEDMLRNAYGPIGPMPS